MAISPLLLDAWVLGLGVAAPIGPVNLEIIRRALRNGLASGAAVGLGATLIDLSYFLAVAFGVAGVLGHPVVVVASLSLGGALLAWLGVGALRDGWRLACGGQCRGLPSDLAPGASSPLPAPRLIAASFGVGLGMTAVNPMTIVFWATMPAGLFRGIEPTFGQILAAGLAVWAGTLTWIGALMLTLALARRSIGPRLLGVVSFVGGLVVLFYGFRFWWLLALGGLIR